MKKAFSWLVFGVAVLYGGAFLFHHFPLSTPAQPTQQAQPAEPQPPEAAEASKVVSLTGPLADYMQGSKPSDAKAGSAEPWTPHASDLVRDSPTGTGGVILHKTFAVTATAKFLFEIPAHATNPQLRGTYQSYLKQTGDAAADGDANVEFLLMNQQQYADFARGRQADVLYFVESSHSQQVDFGLAPTYDKPAQYCLVFRNRSSGAAKKIVQADFSVDY